MISGPNRVKQKLAEGGTALGFVCRSLSPVLVELIGLAGFDFAWIDMEHTAADFSQVEHLCRAADAVGIESLVRVPDQNPSSVLRALEAGAGIINVPQVESAAQAEAVVRAARFHPQGHRGFSSSSRGTAYGFGGSAPEIFAAANERVMTMVQIESCEGVNNAEAICAVPHLDLIFVGLADLSQSLGVVGELEHPRVLEAARHVLAAALRNNRICAILVDDAERARKWQQDGVRVLCCGVDIPVIGKMLRQERQAFENLRGAAAE